MSIKLSLPRYFLHDPSLMIRDIRVMGAISELSNKTGICQVARSIIASAAGVHDAYVSVATSRLCSNGWIEKDTSQRPIIYAINWENSATNSVTLGSDKNPEQCYQSGNTNNIDSDTDLVTLNGDSVTNLVTLNRDNDTNLVTLGSDSDTNLVTLAKTSDTNLVTLNRDNDTNLVTLGEPPNIYINKYIYTSDLIRSDSDKRAITSLIETMICQGMPLSFLKDKTDREIFFAWLKAGITEDDLRRACDRALKAGGTIGPRYVNKVLATMKIIKPEEGSNASNRDTHVTAEALGFATSYKTADAG